MPIASDAEIRAAAWDNKKFLRDIKRKAEKLDIRAGKLANISSCDLLDEIEREAEKVS